MYTRNLQLPSQVMGKSGKRCTSILIPLFPHIYACTPRVGPLVAYTSLDAQRKVVRVILLDFRNAFGRVDHTILLHKLAHAGIYNFLTTVGNSISNQPTTTHYKCQMSNPNVKSIWSCINDGVPQGTLLGPAGLAHQRRYPARHATGAHGIPMAHQRWCTARHAIGAHGIPMAHQLWCTARHATGSRGIPTAHQRPPNHGHIIQIC